MTYEIIFQTFKDNYIVVIERGGRYTNVSRDNFYKWQNQLREVTTRDTRFTITPNTVSYIILEDDKNRLVSEIEKTQEIKP